MTSREFIREYVEMRGGVEELRHEEKAALGEMEGVVVLSEAKADSVRDDLVAIFKKAPKRALRDLTMDVGGMSEAEAGKAFLGAVGEFAFR